MLGNYLHDSRVDGLGEWAGISVLGVGGDFPQYFNISLPYPLNMAVFNFEFLLQPFG